MKVLKLQTDNQNIKLIQLGGHQSSSQEVLDPISTGGNFLLN